MLSHSALQIHFDDQRHHWVLSSFSNGEVRLYDSLSSPKFTIGMEKQLLQLYKLTLPQDSNALLVTSVSVQQQKGICDCGLFSIAFAVHIAARQEDVSSVAFDQKEMRSHLIRCLTKKELSPFPRTRKAAAKFTKLHHLSIPAYCHCKRPDTADEMIQCDRCDEWWHFQCANIRRAPSNDWYCLNCI